MNCSIKFCLKIHFRRLKYEYSDSSVKDIDLIRSLSREAAHQLLVKASDIANSDDKKRNLGEKAARRDPDFVCVHIRRLV